MGQVIMEPQDHLAAFIDVLPSRLHAVIENFLQHSTELPERFLVHPQRTELLVQGRFLLSYARASRRCNRPLLKLLSQNA
jgi:hypothetical protein